MLKRLLIKIQWQQPLWKALLASLLFLLLVFSQGMDLVREQFEDFAFDVTNKFALSLIEQDTYYPIVSVFTFDNAYMQANKLFDEDNNPEYGYIFPRERIAQFINAVDQRIQDPENPTQNLYCPKALFIDFRLDFTTNANHELSKGDQELIDTLKKPRCYPVLLTKNKRNFIEQREDKTIQKLIKEQKIIFVSPYFHIGSDNLVRRYEPVKTIDGMLYPSAATALWQISNNQPVNADQIKAQFIDDVSSDSRYKQEKRILDNVNANIIWIKKYEDVEPDTTPFPLESYWTKLEKYSLGHTEGELPLQKVDSDNFNDGLILLGGTFQANSKYYNDGDQYDVLNFLFGTEKMSGLDVHAHSLMTLFHLNGPMENMPPWVSILIIFINFFLFDLLIIHFSKGKMDKHVALIALLVINVPILFFISLFFLQSSYLWFNWAIPLIMIEISDVVIFLISYASGYFKNKEF